MDRAAASCPYATEEYDPAPGAQRAEQTVSLVGGECWTGRICPGALLDDPAIGLALRSFGWLRDGFLPSPEGWEAQPAWWTAAMEECRFMVSVIEREAVERARNDAHTSPA